METAIKLPNGKVITKKDNKELNELQKWDGVESYNRLDTKGTHGTWKQNEGYLLPGIPS